MSEHLPECDHLASRVTHWTCICQELSAREQRVREGWYEVQSETWEQGFYHALDAAREAVEQVSSLLQPLGPALAAIDALKEDR